LKRTFSRILLKLKDIFQGNGVVWKPSDTAILSNYWIYKIFKEAGFPDGLVNFVPAEGPVFGKAVTSHKDLAAINFTGSVP
jgi:1-pyrroline-5-carboxylate dehydrogenase